MTFCSGFGLEKLAFLETHVQEFILGQLFEETEHFTLIFYFCVSGRTWQVFVTYHSNLWCRGVSALVHSFQQTTLFPCRA